MKSKEEFFNKTELSAKWCGLATVFSIPISTSGTTVLFLLTLLLTLASGRWTEKYRSIKNNPVTRIFLCFYLIFLLGIVYTIATPNEALKQLVRFQWLLFAPLLTPLFIEKKWQQRAVSAFLISMLITLILSYVKYLNIVPYEFFKLLVGKRMAASNSSVFKDYIIQSFLMSLVAMLFLQRALDQALEKRSQFVYGLLFLLAAIDVMFINESRTGYIVFVALLLLTLYRIFKSKKTFFLTSLISLLLMSTLLYVLPGAIHERANVAGTDIQQWQTGHQQTSLGFRMAWQRNALHLIKQRPFFGYGTNSLRAAYATLPTSDTAQTGIVDNTSNEYLNIAVQFGLVGLIVFLAGFLMLWRYSFRLPKEYALMTQTLLVALAIGNLVNSWLMDFTQSHYFAMLMVVAFSRFPTQQEPSRARVLSCNDDAQADTHA